MRKIKLYIAASLNGQIAKKDGSVDWLENMPNPDQNDYGYQVFYDSVDTTIQGYNTYKQIIDWGIEFPYKKTKNYVLTHRKDVKNTDDVEFINHDPVETIQKLKRQEGKDIWLIGGGTVNAFLLNEGLIDEIRIFIMPILLPEGIGVFASLPEETQLVLKEYKEYQSGAIELRYRPA